MKQKLHYWILILVYGAILWFGLVAPVEANDRFSQANINHILSRLSFGNTSEQLRKVEEVGIEAYIQAQLDPQNFPESDVLNDYLDLFEAEYQNPTELHRQYAKYQKTVRESSQLSREQKAKLQRKKNRLRPEAKDLTTDIRLARAIYSSRQLQEVMVDFWFNHFNVFATKGLVSFWLRDYEDKIRDRALGNFRDLLDMTSSHPAMLMYLDNQFNTDPNSPLARGRYSGLNENYARELMELHTLGVDGGYSQEDIITLARIFTGWTLDINRSKKNEENNPGFLFNSKRHDGGEKVFLGHKIVGSGIEEGKQALDILANHPATAHFISYKLAQYFVADEPPGSLVDSLAQTFTASNGNIKVVMDALIHSPEFSNPEYYQQKFKTPYQYLISLVRIAEIEQPNLRRIQGMLGQLSMPIYLCVPPTGYANTQDAWLNPQAMLQRITMATAIANQKLDPESTIENDRLIENLGELSSRTKQVIAESPQLSSALILGSPEAMYR